MNYIRHLNAFFTFVKHDDRLTASHVSLYLALFQYWNFNRFTNPFPIYRSDIMRLCKIGSKNTYHKCIKELHLNKYIFYHPASHKYQPVKISIIRLDKDVPKNPEQLNLFNLSKQESLNADSIIPTEASLPLKGGDLEGGFSPKTGTHTSTEFGTTNVPDLTDTCPNNETNPVPKMGHLIKQSNNKQERETPTHQIFKKNKKIQEAINEIGQVPNSVHIEKNIPSLEGIGVGLPSLNEVQVFFSNSSYPATEAKKFYNHYKAIGWKIQGKTPIEDWSALAEKWMENAKKWDVATKTSLPPSGGDIEGGQNIQFLYERFLEGKKIFRQILPEHFDQLKLEISEETIQQAWEERINQVSGTNQHSLVQLWQAYLNGDPQQELIQKDKSNLIALAKRIEVLKHFQQQKQSGKLKLQ